MNRQEEQQAHRRLAEVVFPSSHASACLDSFGILKEEAEQEGFAQLLSSARAASALRSALHWMALGEVVYCSTAQSTSSLQNII